MRSSPTDTRPDNSCLTGPAPGDAAVFSRKRVSVWKSWRLSSRLRLREVEMRCGGGLSLTCSEAQPVGSTPALKGFVILR